MAVGYMLSRHQCSGLDLPFIMRCVFSLNRKGCPLLVEGLRAALIDLVYIPCIVYPRTHGEEAGLGAARLVEDKNYN